MHAEERSRESMTVSRWRKHIFLSDDLDRIVAEVRVSDAKSPGERLTKVMAELTACWGGVR